MLDGESFESWAAALTDYSLRLAAMGSSVQVLLLDWYPEVADPTGKAPE